MSASQLSGRQRFFVFGLNKSGTTFLQSLLNSHPTICCPSEHHFLSIWKVLNEGINGYRRVIEDIDRKTARQGVTLDDEASVHLAYRASIESLFGAAGPSEDTHVGLNDNSLDSNLQFHADMFPDSKFIFILRDPRDVAVSLFYHRKRTEPDYASSIGTVSDSVAIKWVEVIENVTEFSKRYPGRIEIVRYEDLISAEKHNSLQRILGFLGLPTSEVVISQMFAANDLSKLKKKEAGRKDEGYGFYRNGKNGGWRAELSDANVAAIERHACRLMKKLQYQLATKPGQASPV